MTEILVTVTERHPRSFLLNPTETILFTGAKTFYHLGKEIIGRLQERLPNVILHNVKAEISRVDYVDNVSVYSISNYDLLKNYQMKNSHVYVHIDCICLKVNDIKFIFDKDEYIIDSLEFIARLLDTDRKRFLYNGELIDYSKIHVRKCFQLQENILTIKSN